MKNKEKKKRPSSNRVAAYWNKRGETYSEAWRSEGKKRLNDLELGLIDQAIVPLLERNRTVKPIKTLDVGVGTGRISEKILEYQVCHFAIDISQTMVNYCKAKFSHNNKIKNIKTYNITRPLPVNWGKFDLITAYRVLSYAPPSKLEAQLKTIKKQLKLGGTLIFTYPNKYSLMIAPKIVFGKKLLGNEIDFTTLKRYLQKLNFSSFEIFGYSRLFDTLYDKCKSQRAAWALMSTERLLSLIFGKRRFARVFYVVCKN